MNQRCLSARNGVLMVCVLVCLLVAGALVVASTQTALDTRRHLHLQHQMRQTELLLDAGILRATQRLRFDESYDGETWQPSGLPDKFGEAMVEINVTRDSEALSVNVSAVLGAGDDAHSKPTIHTRTKRTHAFQISLPKTSPPDAE